MERTRNSPTTTDPVEPGPASRAHRGIVDLVLVLYRSPALRFELRERPLPEDIDVVLRMAAASQSLLDELAAQRHESPGTLVDAARFYLQQVLFEPGTDAFRILGVSPDAPQAQLREHHRWLQRWLHPDRAGDDASPFAPRINWAWQQLRDERRRAAYVAAREVPAPANAAPDHPVARRGGEWTTVPPAVRPGRWWRRAALAVAFGSCLLLFYLALIRSGPPPELPAPTADHPSTPHAAPATESTSPSTPLTRRVAAAAARPAAAPATPAHAKPAAAKPPRTEPVAATQIAAAEPRKPTPSGAIEPPAKPAAHIRTRPRHGAERIARQAPARTLPVPPTLHAAAEPPKPDTVSIREPRPTPAHVLVEVAQVAAAPTVPVAVAVAERSHAATPPPPTTSPPATAPDVAPAVLLRRVELARKRVDSLVAYFRGGSDGTPAWQQAQPPFNATLQRQALRQRNGAAAATFALDRPVWRVSGNHVAMQAAYRVQRANAPDETGRFQLRMVWQDRAWQVTRIELEPHG